MLSVDLVSGTNYLNQGSINSMFWLKFVAIIVILTAGIFLIAFLEDTFVSAPRRRALQRKARARLEGKEIQE
jgi:hypothetical protein